MSLTRASPRLTTQWPGNGLTYIHPSSGLSPSGIEPGGGKTCKPPSLLNSSVTEPKSVCAPRAVCLSSMGCGGERTKRTWSPEWLPSLCSAGRVPPPSASFGSESSVLKRCKMRLTIAWALVMYDDRSGRYSSMSAGAGNGSERPRMSSLAIYSRKMVSRRCKVDITMRLGVSANIVELIPVFRACCIDNTPSITFIPEVGSLVLQVILYLLLKWQGEHFL